MPVGDPSPPTDDPLIGKVLSERYRIVRKIGEGGMGAVYQAEHALIEKKMALKILFQDLTRRPDLIARFLQEAKSASRMRTSSTSRTSASRPRGWCSSRWSTSTVRTSGSS